MKQKNINNIKPEMMKTSPSNNGQVSVDMFKKKRK
jgi:hypothetical protein